MQQNGIKVVSVNTEDMTYSCSEADNNRNLKQIEEENG